jgi:hypothetical protein
LWNGRWGRTQEGGRKRLAVRTNKRQMVKLLKEQNRAEVIEGRNWNEMQFERTNAFILTHRPKYVVYGKQIAGIVHGCVRKLVVQHKRAQRNGWNAQSAHAVHSPENSGTIRKRRS